MRQSELHPKLPHYQQLLITIMYNLLFILLLTASTFTCCSQTLSSTRDFTCLELEVLLKAPVVLDAFCLSEVKSRQSIRVTDVLSFYSCGGTLVKYDRKVIPIVVSPEFSVDHNAGYYREVVVNKRTVLEADGKVEVSVYISGFFTMPWSSSNISRRCYNR